MYKSFWAMSLYLLWTFQGFGQYEQVIAGTAQGFGASISVDENRAIIGSPDENMNRGAAYYYEYNGSEWVEKQRLFDEEMIEYANYGFAVAVDGDWALISMRRQGAIFYHFENGQWQFHQKVVPDSLNQTSFGRVLSLQGSKAIISDYSNSELGNGMGLAYYYELEGSSWIRKQKLFPSGEVKFRLFGFSVNIYEDWLAIGEIGNIVHIYHYEEDQWIETQTIESSPDLNIPSQRISLYGEWLALGDAKSKIFKRINNRYEFFQEIDGPSDNPDFPNSQISINDQLLVISNISFNNFKGGAYVYRYNGRNWGGRKELSSSEPNGGSFGHTLAIEGNQIWLTDLRAKMVMIAQSSNQYFVSTTDSSGVGSLSQALADAPSGATITFDGGLASDTIFLANEPINISKNLKLLAPSNATVILDGNSSHSIFNIDSTAEVYIEGFTFQHADSGAIANQGSLKLFNCTFRNNEAINGGAVANQGTLCIEASTFYQNSSTQVGGAIFQGYGISTIKNSTFTLNISQYGGALGIDSLGIINLGSCTIGNNSSEISGGGIYNLGQLSTQNTIIAANLAPNNPDIFSSNPATSQGYNLIGQIVPNQFITQQASDIWGDMNQLIDPRLGLLKDNGGITQTIALRPNSPAIGSGNADTLIYDQRGVFRNIPTDIGALDGISFCDEAPNLVTSLLDDGPGSLRQVIAEAEGGDTIRFSECVLGDTLLLTSGPITIDKDLTIWGADAHTLCINADYKSRIFNIRTNTDVKIRGLTLFKGYNFDGGAIVQAGNSKLQIVNCLFRGNVSASNGGAISGYGELRIDSCAFIQNKDLENPYRLPIYGLITHDNVFINHSYFEDNVGGEASIIYSGNLNSKCTIKNSTIYNHQTFFTHLFLHRGDLEIDNCTIFKNGNGQDYGYGGLIGNNYSGGVTILNSTILGNNAKILNMLGGYINIGNTIIARNQRNFDVSPGASGTPPISLGGNIIDFIDDNDFPQDNPTDQIGTYDNPINPLVDSILRDNGGGIPTLALLPNSPAIDAGVSELSEFDQRGFPRIGLPDIGAFEYGCLAEGVSNIADAGPSSLRQLIADARDGDTIRFSGCLQQDTILLNSTILIEKSVTILAEELGQIIITTTDSFSLFHILPGKDVYFQHISFHNAKSDSGAVFYNEGNLTIESSHWTELEAYKGGAIYNTSTASLYLKNARFQNAKANQGGIIWNAGSVTVEECFLNNFQANQGGAVFNEGSALIRTSTISDGFAQKGGAIFNAADLNIRNSTLAKDSAAWGGAIYQDIGNTSLSSVTIAYNHADSVGGGLFIGNSSVFNSVNTLIGENTGAVHPDIHLQGVWHTEGHNLIGMLEGAPTEYDSTDIIGTLASPVAIQIDSLRDNGGFSPTIALTPCSPAIENGIITDSLDQIGRLREIPTDIGAFEGEASIESGALVINTNQEGPGSLKYVIDNAQHGDTIRFDLCLSGKKISLGDRQIHINKILTFIGDSINPPILVTENFHHRALFIESDTVSFYHLIFDAVSNHSSQRSLIGGPNYLILRNCEFKNYQITSSNAVIRGNTLDIKHCSFKNLKSINSGVFMFGRNILIDSCHFEGNENSMINLYDYQSLYLTNSSIKDHLNIFLNNEGYSKLKNCTFEQDSGLTLLNRGRMFLNSTNFIENNADLEIIANRKYLQVEKSLFLRNQTYAPFGIIHSDDTLLVSESRFIENVSNSVAGAVYSLGYAKFINSAFISNHANSSAGALLIQAPTAIDSCNFIGNTADRGGAILHVDSMLTITNSVFDSNGLLDGSAISQGGGAIQSGGSLFIDNCRFENNEAEMGSAFLNNPHNNSQGYHQTIQNSSFGGHGLSGEGVIQLSGGIEFTLNNSTLYDNHISAIKNASTVEVMVSNSTISQNEIGIDNDGILTLSNTIVANNIVEDLQPAPIRFPAVPRYTSEGYNVIGNVQSTNFPAKNTDIIGTNSNPIDPLLGSPTRGNFFTSTMALLPGSPAINAGNSGDELLDQRGLPRDAMPDIGAFEFAATNECVFVRWEAGDQFECNDSTGVYKQQISIQYLNAPERGSLFVELRNAVQADTMALTIESNAVNLEVEIPLNSGNWSISGWFSDSVQCNFYQADFFTALETCVQPEPAPIYRVNAGGIEMQDSLMNWEIDKQNNPSPYVNASESNNTTGWDGDQSVQNESGIPTKIFGTNRWDGSWGEEMKWRFPVTNGDYVVNLYFAEIKSNSASVGARVFDILAEDQTAINALDVFEEVGYKVALKKQIEVSVSDGLLEIELLRIAGNPIVSAIEILGYEMNERKLHFFNQFMLYPNPAKDMITIQSSYQGNAKVIIRNALGQQVMVLNTILKVNKSIPISHLAKGIYHLEINTGKEIFSRQFIKD